MMPVLTSRSRVLVTVVMTPVFGWMANRSNPDKRVYLILTWRVPGLSLSVASTFPTTVPVVKKIVIEFIITKTKSQTFKYDAYFMFLTCFALLKNIILQWIFELWIIVILVIYIYSDGQR